MIMYRMICAALVAWAMQWAMMNVEAADLILEIPSMIWIAPLAGGLVGFFNLASRQGWGVLVAIANGLWVGVLCLALSGLIYTCYEIAAGFINGNIANFSAFLDISGDSVQNVLEYLYTPPLLFLVLLVTAIVGFTTEIMRWLMVRLLRRYGLSANKEPDTHR